jgi:glycosyltransferase involved in cell wall biosynthesis
MTVSVVIPAHNEENYIGSCLDSIEKAGKASNAKIEIIVVLNRCTDRTEEIAKKYNSQTVVDNSLNLSKIRNAGLYAAQSDVLVTLDADSIMSEDAFIEIVAALNSGKCIGGGSSIKFDRYSPGLFITDCIKNIICYITGLSGGMFWFLKKDFDAVHGFDEKMFVLEDVDFARRLRTHGKQIGKKFIKLPRAYITTSSRKFDRFGDWTFLRLIFLEHARLRKSIKGCDNEFSLKYWYGFNDK